LKDRTLYAGHDIPNKYHSSYKNTCEVKYVKYFANAIADLDEIKEHSDCSKDKCKELGEPGSCDEPTLFGNSPWAGKFTDSSLKSGTSYAAMGWVKCENNGGNWANVWHLSPDSKDVPRNPSLFFRMSNRTFHPSYTNGAKTNGNIYMNTNKSIEWG